MAYVLAHTHGIGTIDFSTMHAECLESIQALALAQDLYIAPSVFLTRKYFGCFREVLHHYSANVDRFDRILGFSVEGPLLGTEGGVPSSGVWIPTLAEWEQLCSFGHMGLRYMVIAPDRYSLDSETEGDAYKRVFERLYKSGIKVALGHFRHDEPHLSADRTRDVINHIHTFVGKEPENILTDHLFNDMPRLFKHAWRTDSERALRDVEISEVLAGDWNDEALEELLGPVPACLLAAAKRGDLLPFLNFDGLHVDIEICKKTVGYVGCNNVIGITDDTSIPQMAGETLHGAGTGDLWLRSDGVVAAGSSGISRQIDNMIAAGFDEQTRYAIFCRNGVRALTPMKGIKSGVKT